MKPIPHETREQLKEDLGLTVERVERIKKGKEPNFRVLDHQYLTPLVDDTKSLPLDHEHGEYLHMKEVGHMVLNILTQGRVPEKFRAKLAEIKAPSYILDLPHESG